MFNFGKNDDFIEDKKVNTDSEEDTLLLDRFLSESEYGDITIYNTKIYK